MASVSVDAMLFRSSDHSMSVIGRLAVLLGSEENAIRILFSLLLGLSLSVYLSVSACMSLTCCYWLTWESLSTESWPDLRLKWPQVDDCRPDHIRLDLTWLDSGMSTWVDFEGWVAFRLISFRLIFFLIGGPTTTTCFVVFCLFDKFCFVVHHFFLYHFFGRQ